MQHPFLDLNEITKLSLDEIQEKISNLTGKLTFAYRMRNEAMVAQLQMVIETYKMAQSQKLDEVFKKQNIPNQIRINEGSK